MLFNLTIDVFSSSDAIIDFIVCDIVNVHAAVRFVDLLPFMCFLLLDLY